MGDSEADSEPFFNEHPDISVNLVETQLWVRSDGKVSGFGYDSGSVEYVTLSHCRGDRFNEHHRLSSKYYEDFKKRISIGDLPRTFRDAMQFAAKLKNVGYLWIDSLCIIQDDSEDWLQQSASMSRVYSESYLISLPLPLPIVTVDFLFREIPMC